jgi:monoamine oxidase
VGPLGWRSSAAGWRACIARGRLKGAGLASTVYEGSDRTGGRIFSLRGFFAEGQVAELGGELVDSNHATMIALAEEFGFTLDLLKEPAGSSIASDTFYFGGRLVPVSEVLEAFRPLAPVMLAAVELAESDDEVFEELDEQNIAQWLDAQPEANELIKDLLKVAYLGEYGQEAEKQSILNLLYLIGSDDTEEFRVFGDSDEAYHTHEGNDSFTSALAERIEGQVKLGHKLVRASQNGDGSFALTFSTSGGEVEVEADKLVFAIPFTTLREVDLGGLSLPDWKREVIAELDYGFNSKLMGGFSRKVWREDHAANASCFCDLTSQGFWDTARGQAGNAGLITNFVGGQRALSIGDGTPESQWADTVLDDLDEVYPGSKEAFDGKAARMHWPGSPWVKGSYACYSPGQWRFYGTEGERVGDVFFCGEHTSLDFQGYMEGAAETGALVALEIAEDEGLALDEAGLQAVAAKVVLPQATWRAKQLAPSQARRLGRKRAAKGLFVR